MNSDRFGGSIDEAKRNAVPCWVVLVLLAGLAIWQGLNGSYGWLSFIGIAITLVVLPTAVLRDPYAMPPWVLLVLVGDTGRRRRTPRETLVSPIAVYLAVAAVALIVAVDVHTFTSVRMSRSFTVVLVVIATLAVGATWNIAQWTADATLGTAYLVGDHTQDAANHAMMIDFLYAAIAGSVAGVLFTGYLRRRSFVSTASTEAPDTAPAEESDPTPSFVRGRFDVPRSISGASRGRCSSSSAGFSSMDS